MVCHLVISAQLTSEKDQGQYWFLNSQYSYVSVTKFAEGFQSFHVGNALAQELAIPFDKRDGHPAALSSSTYGVKKSELLKISFDWQLLLLKRNSAVLVFKVTQVIFLNIFFAKENLNEPCFFRSLLELYC